MGDSKAGGGVKSYDYYGSIAAVICEGPVDALHFVIIDNKEVWPCAPAWKLGDNVPLDGLKSANGRTWIAKQAHAMATSNAPPNPDYWDIYGVARSSDYATVNIANYGVMRIYWGTQTQTVDEVLTAAGNDKDEDHPAYQGICYVVLVNFLLGRERTSAPNLEVVVSRKPNQSIVADGGGKLPASLRDGQANLVAAACELLTSANAIGLPVLSLDDTSLQEAAEDVDDVADIAACSILLDRQQTFRAVSELLQELSDTVLRYNPVTGLIEAKAYVHGSAPLSFHQITVDHLAEPPKFSAQGWPSVKTGAAVMFHDRTRGFKQTSEKVDDLRALRVVGEHRRIQLDRPSITRREQAIAHAAETLRMVGRPQFVGDIVVRREKGSAIRAGDWIKLDIDLEPGGAQLLQYFRVISREMPFSGPIRLRLEADETLTPIPYSPSEPLVLPEDVVVPDIIHRRIVEAPSTTGEEMDYLIALVERPSALLSGACIWFDTAEQGDYQHLATLVNFAARAALRADITAAGTTIGVAAPDQIDLDRFNEDPGDIPAADDNLLAFLVKVSGGQVVTDASGFPWVEALSISAQELVTPVAWGSGVLKAVGDVVTHNAVVYRCIDGHTTGSSTEPGVGADWADYWAVSPNNYDLTVLRGRRGTMGRVFGLADTEVWIIPRSLLVEFSHQSLPVLRAAGDPAWIKIQPFTYTATRDIDDCDGFSVTLAAAVPKRPVLALTSPATLDIDVSAPFPAGVTVQGTWTDENGDLISTRIVVRTATSETVVYDEIFTPCASKAIDRVVSIPEAGTFYIDVIGTDLSNLETVKTIEVTSTGSGPKLPRPYIFWAGMRQRNCSGIANPTELSIQACMSGIYEFWCEVPGVTIEWTQFIQATLSWVPWYANDNFLNGGDNTGTTCVLVRAKKTGYTDSDYAWMGTYFYPVNFPPPA